MMTIDQKRWYREEAWKIAGERALWEVDENWKIARQKALAEIDDNRVVLGLLETVADEMAQLRQEHGGGEEGAKVAVEYAEEALQRICEVWGAPTNGEEAPQATA